MHSAQAAPVGITILADNGLGESKSLIALHRSEAERIYRSALKGGLSKPEALAKAARPIRAAQRAQILHRANLEAAATA